jgi:hypothetical protein
MKTLFLTLLLATLCAATGYGQTIKSLGYNTTNGNVVYTGTNNLFFTNDVYFLRIETEDLQITSTNILQLDSLRVVGSVGIEFEGGAAATRTNLGLGATWLTNDNVTNFRSDIGIPLPALTNTNNADTMRSLAGSTNTNEPFSGSVVVDTNTLVFTNGILLEVTTP